MDAKTFISLAAVIISVVALLYNVLNNKHKDKKDGSKETKEEQDRAIKKATEDAVRDALLNQKLDSVLATSQGIEDKVSTLCNTVNDVVLRLAMVEESAKQAHQKIGQLESIIQVGGKK